MNAVVGCISALSLVLVACSGQANHGEHPDPTEVTVPTAPSVDEPAPEPNASSSSEQPSAEVTCLMHYVCTCNDGCSGVRVPRADLRVGMKVKIASGFDKGGEAFVATAPQEGGGDALVLGRDAPGGLGECRALQPSPYLGYLCSIDNSGPVKKNACASGCGTP